MTADIKKTEEKRFQAEVTALTAAAHKSTAETVKILPTISTRAICAVLLDNDGHATPGTGSADKKPHANIFEAIVYAALSPEMRSRMVLAAYVIYHVMEVTKLRLKNRDASSNGYLPKNPLVMEKISPDECGLIATKLNPANFKPEMEQVIRRVFDRFVELVNTKKTFSPAQRWRDIQKDTYDSVAESLSEGTEGERYLNPCDEKTLLKFNHYTETKRPDGTVELRIENRVRKTLREVMAKRGLPHSPICKGFDPYLKISIEKGSEEKFVLPLNKKIVIEVMNPLNFITCGKALATFKFVLEAYADIRNGKRFDHKTLIKEGSLRVRANKDGRVVFETEFDALMQEPSIAEITIKSLMPTGDQFSFITENVIVLPEGETTLKAGKDFASTVTDFVKAGKMTQEEADLALCEIAEKKDAENEVDILLREIDFIPDKN